MSLVKKQLLALLVVLCGLFVSGSASAEYFVGSCSGKRVKAATLNGACKKNAGEVIVKCANKCVKRKGLKCKKREWKLKKSKTCEINRASKKNRLKTRKCNSTQIATLNTAFIDAKERALTVKSEIETELRKPHSKATKKHIQRAHRKIKKVLKKLDKKVTITCKNDKGMCDSANAHTVAHIGRGLRVCSGFFSTKGDARWRAGVIVHELTHKTGANDASYTSSKGSSAKKSPLHSGSGPRKTSSKRKAQWSKIADSYEYWIRFGFCVPGKTCAE